jgi:ribosome biogenesis GTPase
MKTGQIIEGRGGLYTVAEDNGDTWVLRAMNKLRRANLTPLVGDRVRFTPGTGEEHGWLTDILPRTSYCLRPPVANIDLLCLTVAPTPQPDWLLVDKVLLFARMQHIIPLLVVNKCDLSEDAYQDAQRMYAKANLPVLRVSAQTGQGMDMLHQAMQGHLCCFAGQSGVGKSRLISQLLGIELVSQSISEKIERGKQTTRHTSLLTGHGLRVLDTPGFSLLETPELMEPSELPPLYPEFVPYQGQCRFLTCLHNQEPGCAVVEAEQAGLLDADRMARYRQLLSTIQTNWRERYD